MEFWIKAAQLILSLSILVILHEFGHFIPARLFKTRVEKFYLFFNPWFSLVKKKIGQTEWGIGWLPLGGYVKISGMIDESMDKEQLKQPAQPWEFRSKPAWQRLIIMIGGVTVNIIVGFLIYIFVFFTWGEEVVNIDQLQSGVSVHPYMEKYGVSSGDLILEVGDEKVRHINDINSGLLLRDARTLKVKHSSGEIETITLPEEIDYELFREGAMPVADLRRSNIKIHSFEESDSTMLKAGFKKGDRFLTMNGEKIEYYDDINRIKHRNKNKDVTIEVLRNQDTLVLSTKVNDKGQLGFIQSSDLIDSNAISTKYYGFGESLSKGTSAGITTLNDYVSQLKFLFTKKGASSIGGFAAIGGLFAPVWDWHHFWLTTALISIILAFMNILPIPALDGGHVVFLLYEIITRKEAPQKVLEYAQYVGFFLLMGLLIYANGNDLYRWLFQ